MASGIMRLGFLKTGTKMARNTIYRSAITGEIVTKQFEKDNPDTTVKETMQIVDIRKELKAFFIYFATNGEHFEGESIEFLVDEYLKQK